MKSINSTHSFEVPIYKSLDRDFLENMKMFSKSLAIPVANVQYFRENLTFTSIDENGAKILLSVSPIAGGLSKYRVSKAWQQISNFASKFNCAMSLVDKGGIQLSIEVANASDEDKAVYGKEICHIIRTTVVVTDLALEMALDSFFMVIDMSPRTAFKK